MKKLLLSLSLLLLASSCDSPQRNRLATTVNTGNGLGTPTNTTTNPWGTTTGTTGGTTGTTSGTTTSTRPPGFENCDITPSYLYASGINYIGICQSTLDETSVAIKSTVSDSSRTCLIPTYKDNAGNSTYLGNPECFLPAAGEVIMGQLHKTRPGFTSSALNGMMVMKESALTAYYTCMNAFVNFPSSMCQYGPSTSPYCAQLYQQCPAGANTNSYCNQLARNDMATKCNNFKADNSYIDVCLKKPHGLCN